MTLPTFDTQFGELHLQRHQRVLQLVQASGADSILELGCGSGTFLWQVLNQDQFKQVTGVEHSGLSLAQARDKLAEFDTDDRLRLINTSYTLPILDLPGHQVVVMIETIEHIPPGELSKVEQNLFVNLRPQTLIVTTPNAEYNLLYGLAKGEFRDPDHKFEWSRQKFRQWSAGMARRHGYQVKFDGIGDIDPALGHPSQMVIFTSAEHSPDD